MLASDPVHVVSASDVVHADVQGQVPEGISGGPVAPLHLSRLLLPRLPGRPCPVPGGQRCSRMCETEKQAAVAEVG